LALAFRQLKANFDKGCTVGRPSFHRTQLYKFRG
jgi:hypothetical protein